MAMIWFMRACLALGLYFLQQEKKQGVGLGCGIGLWETPHCFAFNSFRGAEKGQFSVHSWGLPRRHRTRGSYSKEKLNDESACD
jgi:hypothetical protein